MYRTNLRELIRQNPTDLSQIITSYPERLKSIEHFVSDEVTLKNQSVDLTKLTGTHHGSYIGQSWQYLIFNGPRIDQRLFELERNPNYYIDETDKSDISFVMIDDELYLSSEGNHRTTIARFFYHYNQDTLPGKRFSGVTVTRIIVDWNAKNTFDQICELLKQPKFSHLSIAAIPNYNNDNSVCWNLYNHYSGTGLKVTRHKLHEILKALKNDGPLNRMLGSEYSTHFRGGFFW